MPELPEVQTIADELHPLLKGKAVVDLWVAHAPMLRRPARAADFLAVIRSENVVRVSRRGKFVWLRLTGRKNIFIHQKFGHLVFGCWRFERNTWVPADAPTQLLDNDPLTKFLRIVFTLDDGAMLALADMRKFGRAYAVHDDEIGSVAELRVGLDPVANDFDFHVLKPLLQKRSVSIKQVLLDQRLIAGISALSFRDGPRTFAQPAKYRESAPQYLLRGPYSKRIVPPPADHFDKCVLHSNARFFVVPYVF